MKKSLIVLMLLTAAATTGCYRTQIINGEKANYTAAPGYDDRFNHNGIFRLVNFSGAHEVGQICPNGWARLENEKGILASVVDIVLTAIPGATVIYSPQNVSVYCKAEK